MSPAVSVDAATEQVSWAPAEAPDPLFTAHCVEEAYAPLFMLVSHCHAYGDVPVDGIMPLTPRVWSTSSFVAETVGADGAVSWVLNVAVPEAVLVVVTGVDAWSVISISNRYDPVAMEAGVMHDIAKDDDAVPEGVAHCDVVACE